MLARTILSPLLGVAAVSLGACASGRGADDSAPVGADDNEVTVDTRTPAARQQYDANVAFVSTYRPTCAKTSTGHPRVMVTGFGRFMSINDNATGRIISKLVPGARYPETTSSPLGTVDPPGAQLNVVSTTLDLPQTGLVDVCAMILPVYWDLASVLIAKEMESFEPAFVMMNGVAGERQPIWIELGSTNRADLLDDGSNQLRPAVAPSQSFAKIVDVGEDARPNLLSWRAVETAARVSVERHANDIDQGTRLGDVLQGVKIAGFPRSSNTYLCNNVTYVTSYVMAHPQSTVRLLKASPALRNQVNEVAVKMANDFRNTPRVFVHWPSEMASRHHAAGADIMRAVLDAQLVAIAKGDRPTFGDNKLADPTLQGGKFF